MDKLRRAQLPLPQLDRRVQVEVGDTTTGPLVLEAQPVATIIVLKHLGLKSTVVLRSQQDHRPLQLEVKLPLTLVLLNLVLGTVTMFRHLLFLQLFRVLQTYPQAHQNIYLPLKVVHLEEVLPLVAV